jgi:hypothetical protein
MIAIAVTAAAMIAIAVTAAAMTAAAMAAIVRSYQGKLVITSHTNLPTKKIFVSS